MKPPAIPGFHWIEKLVSDAPGEMHRFAPDNPASGEMPHTVVVSIYPCDRIDPDLAAEQWTRLKTMDPPTGILQPVSWDFEDQNRWVVWPDLDQQDALAFPDMATNGAPRAKVRIKPRRPSASRNAAAGGTWSQRLSAPSLASPGERNRITSELLALGAWLHSHDLVHGHLTPKNVWWHSGSEGSLVPVLREVGTGPIGRVTRPTQTAQWYCLPVDQVLGRTGSEPLGLMKSWDVHALGSLLFLLWTGSWPRFHDQPSARPGDPFPLSLDAWQIEAERPPTLRWGDNSLTESRREIIARCLEPDPSARWPDLPSLAQAWNAAGSAAPASDQPTVASPVPSQPRSRRSAAPWLAAIGGLLIGAALHPVLDLFRSPERPPPAQVPPDPAQSEPEVETNQVEDPASTQLPTTPAWSSIDGLLLQRIDRQISRRQLAFSLPEPLRNALLQSYQNRISELESPDGSDQRIALAQALEIRGFLLLADGHAAAAEAAWGRSIQHWQNALEILTGVRPGQRAPVDAVSLADRVQGRLAGVHEIRGRRRRIDGRLNAALIDFRSAARLRSGRLHPGHASELPKRRHAAGRCWLTVAEVHRELGSQDLCAEALAHVDAMLKTIPEDQRDGGVIWLQSAVLHERGRLARAAGNTASAVARQHRAATRLVEHITRTVVVPIEFQRLLGQVYTELAELAAAGDQPARAIEAHSEAVRHLLAVVNAEPGDGIAQYFLSRNYGKLALIERDLGRTDEAVRHLNTAVATLTRLLDDPANQAAETLALAVLKGTLAELTLQQGRPESAVDMVETALSLIDKRLEDGSVQQEDLARWLWRRAELTLQWAEISTASDDAETTRKALELAIKRWQALKDSDEVPSDRVAEALVSSRRQWVELTGASAPSSDDTQPSSDPGEEPAKRFPDPPPPPPLPKLLRDLAPS